MAKISTRQIRVSLFKLLKVVPVKISSLKVAGAGVLLSGQKVRVQTTLRSSLHCTPGRSREGALRPTLHLCVTGCEAVTVEWGPPHAFIEDASNNYNSCGFIIMSR